MISLKSHAVSFDPAILFLDIYKIEMKTFDHAKPCNKNVQNSFIWNTPKLEELQYPSIIECKNELYYIYKIECYSAMKRVNCWYVQQDWQFSKWLCKSKRNQTKKKEREHTMWLNLYKLHKTLINLQLQKTWRGQWQPNPVLSPGKSHGRRSLVGWSPWGR